MKVECPLCPVTKFKCNNTAKVKKHLKTHEKSGIKREGYNYLCLVCHLKCRKSSSDHGHYHCPFCSNTFARKNLIKDHWRSKHSDSHTDSGYFSLENAYQGGSASVNTSFPVCNKNGIQDAACASMSNATCSPQLDSSDAALPSTAMATSQISQPSISNVNQITPDATCASISDAAYSPQLATSARQCSDIYVSQITQPSISNQHLNAICFNDAYHRLESSQPSITSSSKLLLHTMDEETPDNLDKNRILSPMIGTKMSSYSSISIPSTSTVRIENDSETDIIKPALMNDYYNTYSPPCLITDAPPDESMTWCNCEPFRHGSYDSELYELNNKPYS
ncbi:uncharacterized protein LOC102804527, partial [Saccoglossus kowalevskii]